MAKCEEITAEFDYERHAFGNSSADERTIIGQLGDGTTIKGRAKVNALETGLTYRFYGHWINHPKYGRQFAFQSFTPATPHGQRGTVAYLKRGPGIGTKRALAIWDAFGAGSLEAVRSTPDAVAAAVKGITIEKMREAAAYFQHLAGLEAVTIELAELLGSRGFPRRLVEEVLGEWGNEAPAKIRENPYVLMKFRGVGFLKTDALYLELGLPADAIERQAYCIVHALSSDNEGHTWLTMEKCVEHLAKNIAGGEVRATEAVEWALNENLILSRTDSRVPMGAKTWLAEWGRGSSEMRVANCVHEVIAETMMEMEVAS